MHSFFSQAPIHGGSGIVALEEGLAQRLGDDTRWVLSKAGTSPLSSHAVLYAKGYDWQVAVYEVEYLPYAQGYDLSLVLVDLAVSVFPTRPLHETMHDVEGMRVRAQEYGLALVAMNTPEAIPGVIRSVKTRLRLPLEVLAEGGGLP